MHLIKRSLELKAQYAEVKRLIALESTPSMYMKDTSIVKPTATDEIEVLGSRYAQAVVLATGQSSYEEPIVTLQGLIAIDFRLFYLSQSISRGMFGLDRRCSFEKKFYSSLHLQNHLHLYSS